MKYALILIVFLCSCQEPVKFIDDNISEEKLIKKERIIRYKILPQKSNFIPPFSQGIDENDIFYGFYSLDVRLPTLEQFQGYKIIETSIKGDTIKTYIYDTYSFLSETQITISNDSIKFYRTIDPYTKDTYSSYTLTSNNIKKTYTTYERGTPVGGCGWISEPEWDYITHLDSNNNPIKNISTAVQTEQLFKYNSKSDIINLELIKLSTGELLASRDYMYNSDNQLIEENHNSYFSKITKTIHEYKNDTLTQSFNYDFENNLIFSQSTTYDYDKFGNWVKKTESINSTPRFITERQITYY